MQLSYDAGVSRTIVLSTHRTSLTSSVLSCPAHLPAKHTLLPNNFTVCSQALYTLSLALELQFFHTSCDVSSIVDASTTLAKL